MAPSVSVPTGLRSVRMGRAVEIMMNVPCMVHAAKPAQTPTGHTDAAAQRDTSCSLTGYLAEPNK
ncbi:hypothetical protein AMECASPLE_029357, partial [Ameca splendens]